MIYIFKDIELAKESVIRWALGKANTVILDLREDTPKKLIRILLSHAHIRISLKFKDKKTLYEKPLNCIRGRRIGANQLFFPIEICPRLKEEEVSIYIYTIGASGEDGVTL